MEVLIPTAGLVLCVLLHVVASRRIPIDCLTAVALGLYSGAFGVLGLALVARQIEALPVWLATYLLLAYCYVIGVFNLGESSRRIRLLIELHQAPGGALTLEEILVRYNARMVVEARLGRLVATGQLIERDGRYWIKNRVGLWIATVLAGLAPILVHRRR